ncbi:MAG: cytochrome P450/oxidoreductase [Pararhodobacter sp.]|nr:cytochrome P450/oxidoreductase [Pararhodobacter sp.]
MPEDHVTKAPGGCPFSPQARRFDPFGPEYQADPADALRFSREGEPVYFSEVLNHWVVSRYDDIKAVFRDNITFSPANALEKITPPTDEALAVLKQYDFNLQRTLVNEDEPVHTERRRALLGAFAPEALAAHGTRVRALVRERVDAIIDKGRADLVQALSWEVPFLVALNFLGVPEDDHEKLRAFSVAHTLNTWGRPTPEEQIEIAHGVGRFWQYSGAVLERMKAEPAGQGWMHDMIRANRENPEVVTDNYLHSMMMAIIVAAHETTALAGGNMMRRLLEDRTAWEAVCARPELIPNAVEECLRHSGSVVAWRRVATVDAEIGGVVIPRGGKILMVTASANHDPRHFDNPDALDIWRENTAEHLTFGYGSHQCMGKNLGRMELRIMLEELTRRLPHMELVAQEFTFLPNTSFRGPERVLVRWDPARNPERRAPALREAVREFPVGPPDARALAREVVVTEARLEADGVQGLVLEDADGAALPGWSPGAHVDLILPSGESRRYSLCGAPGEETRYRLAILREEGGRGGSIWLHENACAGTRLKLRGPRNHFRLDEDAPAHLLVAGGIGITPVLAMADRLRALGRAYALHYCGRSRARMAFLPRLARDHGAALSLYPGDEGARLDLAQLFAQAPAGAQICACGPERLLDAMEDAAATRPDVVLSIEHFTPKPALDPSREHAFALELADSGITLSVLADRTILQVLREAGIDVSSDCEEGLCGSCEMPLLEGEPDHRDRVLSRAERKGGRRIITCCSRAKGGKLVLGA